MGADSVTSDGDALACAASPLAGCPAAGGRLDLPGHGWAWALPLRSLEEFIGHLVVAGTAEPTPAEQVLLRSLAQQTGVAVANARLHASKECGERRARRDGHRAAAQDGDPRPLHPGGRQRRRGTTASCGRCTS